MCFDLERKQKQTSKQAKQQQQTQPNNNNNNNKNNSSSSNNNNSKQQATPNMQKTKQAKTKNKTRFCKKISLFPPQQLLCIFVIPRVSYRKVLSAYLFSSRTVQKLPFVIGFIIYMIIFNTLIVDRQNCFGRR